MRPCPSRFGGGLALVLVLAGLLVEHPAAGSADAATAQLTADEYGLKGAFLYNLAKFVDWPSEKLKADDAPFVVAVAGPGALDRIAAVVRDKLIEKHKVVFRLLRDETEIGDCHILFITRSQKDRVPEMVSAANRAGVLTLGETDNFLEVGGMIRFYLESDNLRLEIDDSTVRQAGLSIKANALSALINKGIARLRKV